MSTPARSPRAPQLVEAPRLEAAPRSIAAVSPEPAAAPTFHDAFKDNFSYVWHSLRRLGVSRSDLEDITHDVFVVVQRRLGDYDPARPLRPWLFGITYRVAVGHLRLARHRIEELRNDAVLDALDDRPGAHEALEAREARALVEETLAALDLDRRAVLVMHDIDGFSMPEIVAELSIPLDTGYSRLRLAREDFKAAARRFIRRKGAA